MPALSAQGSTFQFGTVTYLVTSVSVDSAQPEVVNMTTPHDPKATVKMVYTGDYLSSGRISVEGFGVNNPIKLVGSTAVAQFLYPGGTVTCNAICDSVTFDAKVGDLLRFRMTLIPTDYVEQPRGR